MSPLDLLPRLGFRNTASLLALACGVGMMAGGGFAQGLTGSTCPDFPKGLHGQAGEEFSGGWDSLPGVDGKEIPDSGIGLVLDTCSESTDVFSMPARSTGPVYLSDAQGQPDGGAGGPDDDPEHVYITGTGETAGDVKGRIGVKYTVVGDWSGSYTGGDGVDEITVNSGVTASGRVWRLGGGANVLRGSGRIEAMVMMGNEDDTIGNFGQLAKPSDNALVFASNLMLAGGSNRVKAHSIPGSVSARSGDDTIILTGDLQKASLAGGKNRIEAGNVLGEILVGDEDDIVIVTGDLHEARLGHGTNRVEAGSVSDEVRTGNGDDTIIVKGDLHEARLKHGTNRVEAGSVSDTVRAGNHDDTIIVKGDLHVARLGHGANRVEAGSVSNAVRTGAGDDIVIVAGDLHRAYFDGGKNRIEAGSISRGIYGGEGEDTLVVTGQLASAHLGGGANRVEAGSVSHGVYGGEGEDTLIVTGRLASAHLGGGANRVEAGSVSTGIFGEGGNDTVFIGGGAGIAKLENGVNSLTVSGGLWSGAYLGGSGKDTITIASDASASGAWDLGDGGNAVKADGLVSGDIILGDGDDVVGGVADGSFALGLGSVSLGGGLNVLRASAVDSVSAGGGDDSVYLRPLSSAVFSGIDLGGGSNRLWVLGASGGSSSREAVVSLSGISPLGSGDSGRSSGVSVDLGSDSLYLCGAGFSELGCGSLSGGDHSLNVVLDARAGSIWETVTVGNPPSSHQSRLSVRGSVTLSDPRLNNLMVSGDGSPGDAITITGSYEILPVSAGSGTLFELDAGALAGVHRSDVVRFEGARASSSGGGSSSVATVTVRMSSSSAPAPGSRLDLVTVDASSDISGVLVQGLSGGEISLGGHVWSFGSEAGAGLTTYFLAHGVSAPAPAPDLEHLVITGTGETAGDVTVPSSVRRVTVAGSWSGSYTGLPGADSVTVDSGVSATGLSWRLFGGDNLLRGSGLISAAVSMGDGDDTVGDFSAGPRSAANLLSFTGSVDLGGGANRMMASSAASVTGGSGSDTIVLGGDVSGLVDLGGGSTSNSLTVGGSLDGDVASAASGPSGVWDQVVISGGSGSIRLGDGFNALSVSGEWSGSYTGGSGPDVITACSCAALSGLRLDLGGGDDAMRGAAVVSAAVSLGDGSDVVGVDPAGAGGALAPSDFPSYDDLAGANALDFTGALDLGGGDNKVWAAGAVSVTAGGGSDSVYISGPVSGHVDLGGGLNRLEAESLGAGFSGGDSEDRVSVSGDSAGRVDLGGGSSGNTLSVGGLLHGDVASLATGRDDVSIGGGSGGVDLGGGVNYLSLSGGSWSGSYTGGSGPDTIRAGEASASGEWDLGGGDNLILASGALSGRVTLGGGNDRVGGASLYPALGGVSLGDGENALWASSASSISGGSGPDSVYLKPASDFSLSSLNLGGGVNSLWVLGRSGSALERRATVPLLAGDAAAGTYRLYLCNEGASALGCGSLDGSGSHAFSAVLDTIGEGGLGGVWDSIKVGVEPSAYQSRLSVRGFATLESPELNDFMLVGDGSAGDVVTVSGSYEMLAPASGRGTLFELDVRTGAVLASDVLRFRGAESALGLSSDGRAFVSSPSIALRASGDGSKPEAGSRLDIVSVDQASDISGVSIVGAGPDGDVSLNGHVWSLSSERSADGLVYYLSYAGAESGVDRLVITGTGETAGDVDLGGGVNYVTVVGDWSGSYTGLEGLDDMTVEAGVTASGDVWNLGGGGNILRGSGTILSRVVMGSGDDTVGGFGSGALASDSALALSGGIELGDGSNRVRAASAGPITGGQDSDSIELSGAAAGHVSLGGGSNRLQAASAVSVSGGSGQDTIEVSGAVTGAVDLGGGSADNALEIGALDGGSVSSSATGRDLVSFGGGRGDIKLGGGVNEVTLSGGAWSGKYEGGPGPDTIRVAEASASGDWDLGDGDNEILASGALSGSISMGGGSDTVGGFPGGLHPALGHVSLGGGLNRLWARSAASISAGAGPDSVYLSPDSSFALSSAGLGGGSNSLWILGGQGAPAGRQVTIPLSGGGSGGRGLNQLYLCNEAAAETGCGPSESGGGSFAFSAALDATGGNAWDYVKVGVEPSAFQSRLSVRGSVTLADPQLNDFVLAGDGSPGDAVTLTGSYEILAPAFGRGTVFELDVATGAASASDILRFEGALPASGQSRDGREFASSPFVVLNVSGDGSQPAPGSRVDIVTVDPASDVSGVLVAGADPDGAVVLDGHSWSLSSESSFGSTVYYLVYSLEAPVEPVAPLPPDDGIDRLVITGTGETAGDVDLGGGINYVTVVGDWTGNYTGLDGLDDMTVEAGVTASGAEWRLGGGGNVLRGSGAILARVFMGAGDDTIGGFGPGAPASDSGLSLAGGVDLGDGENRVRAGSAGPITAGSGPDSVFLSGEAAGHVSLGAGPNRLEASGAVSFAGGPDADTVILSGSASGHVDLGGGVNRLEASAAGSVTGGSGADTVALSGGASGLVDLGGGRNSLRASSAGSVTGGSGDDTVALTGDASGSTNLGGDITLGSGVNELTLSGGFWPGSYRAGGASEIRANGVSASGEWWFGSGNDVIHASGELSGPIRMGSGDDAIEGGSEYPALGEVSLGSGADRLHARSAVSIDAGSEADRVYLMPDLDLALSSLRLGSGDDRLWILGRGGDASGRQVTIPFSEIGSGSNRLYLCNEAAAEAGCGPLAGDHAFSAVLDAGGPNPWTSIKVGVEPSAFQSRLSVRGSVALADPELSDFILAGNGAPGDEVTVTGAYEILAPDSGRGTLFELDVVTGAAVASDVLRFEGAVSVGGLSSDGRDLVSAPTIALRVLGDGSEPAAGSRVEIATVDSASDVQSVSVIGADPGGEIVLDSHAWTLSSEARDDGTVFFLLYGSESIDVPEEPDDGIDRLIITGTGATAGDVDLGGGINYVTVVGDWVGDYTGLDGLDDMTVEAGVAASGDVWNLGGGNNALRGSGTILAKVRMGDGADTVGDFGPDPRLSDNSLALSGGIELGDGENRVRAASVGSVTGGKGPDTVVLSGAATGHVDLGGGANTLRASGAASFAGGPGKDTVILSGDATGKVELGEGENRLEASGVASVTGGPDPDTVILGAGASGLVDLKGGLNQVKAESLAGYWGGPGNDTVILRGEATGEVRLGDGANRLEASGVDSVAGGSGPDTVIVDGAASGAISLGAGSNSLSVKGAIGGDVTSGPTGRDDVSIGGGTGNINLADGANALRLKSGAWSGEYDGGSGLDTILVADGASASGDWKLEGGKDTLRGTGDISGEVDMGAGDDIIGNLAANAPAADSKLVFSGHLILGPGHDKVKAVSAKSIESTGGAEITLSGGISGAVNLAGGWNRVRAESAGSIAINGGAGDFSFRLSVGRVTLGDSEHPHLFEAKSVGEIVISCPGGDEAGSAEPCGESRITVGSVRGGISMTNHVSTFMTVNGLIGGSVTSVSDAGNDRIGFDGGEGDINLGGGENHLALLHGVWSGRYTGGDGTDTIRVRGPAEMTGNLHLGEGDNVLTGSGAISGEVWMGSGKDKVGGFLAAGGPGHLMSLSRIHLGGGDNEVVARRAELVTAGDGADRIALFPESEMEMSKIDLGEGDNELWISGAAGDPESRRVTIPLSRDGDDPLKEDLYNLHICGETIAENSDGDLVCANLAGTDYGLNLALDAGSGNDWDLVQIDNQYNSHVSQLTVTGDVTLTDSSLGFMTVAGNGAAGDSLTMTGGYGIFPYGRGLGTVFELEVDTSSLVADTLRFVSATHLDGDDFGTVAAVRLKAVSAEGGSSAAEEESRIDIVTVDAASDVSGVGVQDLYSGKVTLNGEGWTVGKEVLDEGGAVYYLELAPDTATVSRGSEDLNFGNGINSLTVDGAWSGDYTGGSSKDTVIVAQGATAFGDLDLGGGSNLLRGSGSIHGDILMGSGDDTVGDFGPGASSGGGLELFGHLSLGGGANKVRVAKAAGITGGNGPDAVTLAEGSSGRVALGGGENYLEAGGEVESYSGGSGKDTIKLGEGGSVSGTIVLGGGDNELSAGSGNDRITLEGITEGAIDLGDGDDMVVLRSGTRATGATFSLGKGENQIFVEGAREGMPGMTALDLSSLKGGGSLLICAGHVGAGADSCGGGDSLSGFSVDLRGEAPDGFSVRVENAEAEGQSLLSVSGDLTLGDSELGNVRIVTRGAPGGKVTLAGVQSFAENTVVSLDVSRGGSDILRIDSTVQGAEGAGPAGPLVSLQAAPGQGDKEEIIIARVRSGSGAQIRLSETSVFLDDDIWQVMPSRDIKIGDGDYKEYFLAPEGIDIGARAAAAQQALSASGAITSSIASAAAQARPGLPAGAGVSQDGPGEAGASFWTRVTVGEETERLKIGQSVSEFEQSLWVMNTGAELISHRAGSGELSHSLIAQYGSSSSKSGRESGPGVESTLSGLGYSLLYRGRGGGFGRLSAMSSAISGKVGEEDYSLSGSSISAEAGKAFRAGIGSGSVLTMSPLARLSYSEFGEVSLKSGDSSGIQRASGSLALLADYEWGGKAGESGAKTLYGGVTATHDFQGGFEFAPKDQAGNKTVAIEVDSGKTWVALEAGWAWSMGESGRGFVEAAQASASGEETGGERRSLTLGFDLSW